MSRTLTLIVIFGTVAALIAYDVWAAFTPGATISEVMLSLGHKHPIIPLAMGILIGHFWWSQKAESTWEQSVHGMPTRPPTWNSLPLWLGLGVLALGLVLTVWK